MSALAGLCQNCADFVTLNSTSVCSKMPDFCSTLPWQVEVCAGVAGVLIMDKVPAGGIAQQGLSGQQWARCSCSHIWNSCCHCPPSPWQHYALGTHRISFNTIKLIQSR